MSVIRRCAILAAVLTLAGSLLAQQPSPGQIRVTLLGVAGGPPVRVGRAGISTLVEAGGDAFLFDAGRGVMDRLTRAQIPANAVRRLFLTHLHSDHVMDIPDLLLTPWSSPVAPRTAPFEVWGPAGTHDMMAHLEQAFAFDIHIRRDVDDHHAASGIQVIARDIRDGVVYSKNGVTVTAFFVDHGPVKPALGYRVNYGGHAVCLSGDTRPSAKLVEACRGVDVLVHEAIDEQALRRTVPDSQLYDAIVGHHTTPDQAADIFRRVGPRLAVFSHVAPPNSAVVERTRRGYEGRLEMGDDLMVIDIGADVVVRRSQMAAPAKNSQRR